MCPTTYGRTPPVIPASWLVDDRVTLIGDYSASADTPYLPPHLLPPVARLIFALFALVPVLLLSAKLGASLNSGQTDIKRRVEIRFAWPLPFVDCANRSYKAGISGFVNGVISELRSRYKNFESAYDPLSDWLFRFSPTDEYTTEVLATLKMQMSVGLQCNALYTLRPRTLVEFITDFERNRLPQYRTKFRNIDPGSTEVFAFHHGLFRLNPIVRSKLKTKDFLDIGAAHGDSALVLSQYAKTVHSIEIDRGAFSRMRHVLGANREIAANVIPYLLGIAEKSESRPGQVELTSVDDFVEKHNLTVGFMKADIEGVAYAMCLGAQRTFRDHRPVFSFSSYHTATELFNMSNWLMDFLPDYNFEWHMENYVDWAFFEVSIFGYPREALAT